MKLPKQWRHWAKLAGLRPMGRGVRGERAGWYMIGRGHCWRVNMYGHFQISCPIPEFDRWANSVDAEVEWLPSTEFEFLATVNMLKRESGKAVAERDELGHYITKS